MESVKNELVFLKSLMKGLSELFGGKCEIVLHDHKDQPYESTIIAIENGHITGRTIGDCGTNLGLEVLRGSVENGDRYNYATQTKDGRVLRSSTVYMRNAKNEVVGSLCINFDVSDLMIAEQAIRQICLNPFQNSNGHEDGVEEFFAKDVTDLLDMLIQEALQIVNKPVSFMLKEDKLKVLKYLDRKGAFLIKKSGDRIAKHLDISKYTMYSYLDEIRTSDEI